MASLGEDPNDPTVWECRGQRMTPTGLEFRHHWLTRSVHENLRKQFGHVWLHNYTLTAELAVRAWEKE